MALELLEGVDLDEISNLSTAAFDRLPFGAIQLDAHDYVVRYNATEARLARRSTARTLHRHFFEDVAPCTDNPEFRGALQRLSPDNPSTYLDYVFRFAWGTVNVRVRFMLASDGSRWVFVTKTQ